jgi:hypothetical protein
MAVELVDAYRVSDHRRARMPRTLLDVSDDWVEGGPPATRTPARKRAARKRATTSARRGGSRTSKSQQLADGQDTNTERTPSVDQPQSEED